MKKTRGFNIQLYVIMRCRTLLLLSLVLLIGICRNAAADMAISSGEFDDSSGQVHAWHVNQQHTLVWGGRPWIPAGGLFQSRYLTGPQTDENWNADIADLQTLKQHGIHSLILVTSDDLDSITNLSLGDLQKFLTYLDNNGFEYGLSLPSFPRDPIEATVVNPAIYRVNAPVQGSVNTFGNLSGLVGASYYLVSEADGSIIASGSATVVDAQTAQVTLAQGQGGDGTVLLLYPKRIFLPTSIEGMHLPDIWGKSDQYRDSLLLYFNDFKFGSGLRFFLDPIVPGAGYYGDADAGAIPDGDGYRLQFQIWLQNHYGKSLAKLNSSWGVKNQDVFDFAAASRCIPLWFQSKGIQLLVDPASDKTFQTIALSSNYWDDVKQFRLDSMQNAMNELAESLKNGVADVPVVYRWTRPSRLYVDNSGSQGFDGLLISTQDHGKELASNAAGWALSEAEESGRSLWLTGELTPPSGGYPANSALTADNSVLQSLAVKGYFLDSFRQLPTDSSKPVSLLDSPSSILDWIAADDQSEQTVASSISNSIPNILFYPINLNLSGASVRQLEDGTWWLPSYHDGEAVDIGPGLTCYSMTQPTGGTSLVLWSPDGSVASASFNLPKKTLISATTPSGTIVTISLDKGVYTIPTSKAPILIHGLSTLPLVANGTAMEMVEAQKLIDRGVSEQIPMDVEEQRLYYIKNEILGDGTTAQQQTAYPLLQALIQDMRNELNPNAWVEGEAASQQTFGTVVASPSASNGAFLWEDTDHAPAPNSSYEATYTLNVGAPGDYTIWGSLAPGPPGSGSTSPLSYSLDSSTEYDVSLPQPSGPPYGNVLDAATATHVGSFCWYQLGVITLTPGVHSLNFFITGPAHDTQRYTLGIDAICLSRGTFVPDGPVKPSVQ